MERDGRRVLRVREEPCFIGPLGDPVEPLVGEREPDAATSAVRPHVEPQQVVAGRARLGRSALLGLEGAHASVADDSSVELRYQQETVRIIEVGRQPTTPGLRS